MLRLADADRRQGQGDRPARGHLCHQLESAGAAWSRPSASRGPAHAALADGGLAAKYVLIATGGGPTTAGSPASSTPSPPTRRSTDAAEARRDRRRRLHRGRVRRHLRRLGSEVTLVIAAHILRGFDEESAHVRAEMAKKGIIHHRLHRRQGRRDAEDFTTHRRTAPTSPPSGDVRDRPRAEHRRPRP